MSINNLWNLLTDLCNKRSSKNIPYTGDKITPEIHLSEVNRYWNNRLIEQCLNDNRTIFKDEKKQENRATGMLLNVSDETIAWSDFTFDYLQKIHKQKTNLSPEPK